MNLIAGDHPTGTVEPAGFFLLCVTILLYHAQEVYDTYSTIYDDRDVPTIIQTQITYLTEIGAEAAEPLLGPKGYSEAKPHFLGRMIRRKMLDCLTAWQRSQIEGIYLQVSCGPPRLYVTCR